MSLGQSFPFPWLLSQEFSPPTHKQHSSGLRGLERLTAGREVGRCPCQSCSPRSDLKVSLWEAKGLQPLFPFKGASPQRCASWFGMMRPRGARIPAPLSSELFMSSYHTLSQDSPPQFSGLREKLRKGKSVY